MKKKQHRLFVSKITSIGAVTAADNEPADILLFKAAPHSGGGGRALGSGSTPSPVTATAALFARVDRTLAMSKQRSLPSTETRGQPTMKKSEGRSEAVILAQVDQLAANIQKSGGITRSQSRAEVWKVHPELKVEIRKAQARERDAGKTIAADIDRIIKSYCMSISTEPENRTKTLSQIRNEVMHTAVGVEIKQLRAAARDGKVGSETEILKSNEHTDAWSALKRWDAGTVG